MEWNVPGRGFVFITYVIHSILLLLLPCVMVLHYIVSVLFLMFFWWPCMAINVNVQYNDGPLLDIILLTQCFIGYFH